MKSKKNTVEVNSLKFIDDDDERGSFRTPTKKEVEKAKRLSAKEDSLNSRIDALRDRLKQK